MSQPGRACSGQQLQRCLEHQAGLLVGRRSLWWDDLLQAARIALWQRPDTPDFAVPRLARSAMIDELRRLTPGGRRLHERRCPLMVPWSPPVSGRSAQETPDEWPDTRADTDTPEALYGARETLQSLQALGAGWPEALAVSATLRAAGQRMGVSESRACQVRTRLWRLCGQPGKPPPLPRGVSHV
jgi:hypothetical protein